MLDFQICASVEEELGKKMYELLNTYWRDPKIRNQAERYLNDRKINKISEDEVFTYLKSLTPDGLQPYGVDIHPATNVAYFIQGHILKKGKVRHLMKDIIQKITVPKKEQ